MRIGIITNYHLEQVGGAEEALDRLARHWHRAGHKPVLWASPSRRVGAARRAWQPEYEFRAIPRPFSTRWGLGRYVRYLEAAHHQAPLDVLLASDAYWPGHVARLFAARSAVPYVIYSHGGDCMHGSRFLRRPVIRRRMADTVREAAGVACISRYVERQLRALAEPRGRVAWLPNGWPDEWASAETAPRPVAWPYLMALGRMVELKGFQTLLAAYVRLRERFPQLGLILAGDGAYRQALWNQAVTAGLRPVGQLAEVHPNVPALVLPGFVQGTAKRAWVEHAELGVCPSIREEPQGLVVLEFLCRGVPVVASQVGGIPDMIRPGDNGELFAAGDADQLAAKLSALLADPSRRAAMAAQAAPSVAGLAWSQVAARYLELFATVGVARETPPSGPGRPHGGFWRGWRRTTESAGRGPAADAVCSAAPPGQAAPRTSQAAPTTARQTR